MLTVTHIRRHRTAATALVALAMLCILAGACRQHRTPADGIGEGLRTSPTAYAEGDTLDAIAAPALDAWLDHYRTADTGYRRNAFLASGINLRIDSLEACPPPDTATLRLLTPVLAWSPDSTLAIDIWSYDHLVHRDAGGRSVLEGGGPDQMVKLLDRRSGTARQILFNGPSQVVETADWISDKAFVLGLLNIDEATGEAVPDIVLIHLADSVFTNFRYAGRHRPAESGFVPAWLRSKGIRYDD